MMLDSSGWQSILAEEMNQPYFHSLCKFVEQEYQTRTVYPPQSSVFAALERTPPERVKVVILGQDPYYNEGQAHGLAFSVPAMLKKLPPSLKNIFTELQDDLNIQAPAGGDLTPWADQGVLLLNTVLTVRAGEPNSHRNHGWERFTDAVLQAVNRQQRPVVYMLWGGPAQKKLSLLDNPRHLRLVAPHPSPLSAYRGFFGCRHFSQANAFLTEQGVTPVSWELPL